MFSAPALVRILLDAGADPHVVSANGSTLLHRAASRGHPAVARMLLAAGCASDAANEKGRTPLMLGPGPNCLPLEDTGPEDSNHVDAGDVAAALIAAGADVHARDACGRTALHHALSEGHWEVADALLQAGASEKAAATDGTTPLHAVAEWSQWHSLASADWAIITLVRRGADPEARNAEGQTAAQLAGGGEPDSEFMALIQRAILGDPPKPEPEGLTAEDIDDALDKWF
jgi:ankyrin repeat protein